MVRKKDFVSEVHPSAITDHIAKNNNHIIDWEGMKFPSRDCDTTKREYGKPLPSGSHNISCYGDTTNFHHATSSCCHVMPGGRTDDDSRSLGIKINLPQIPVLKK